MVAAGYIAPGESLASFFGALGLVLTCAEAAFATGIFFLADSGVGASGCDERTSGAKAAGAWSVAGSLEAGLAAFASRPAVLSAFSGGVVLVEATGTSAEVGTSAGDCAAIEPSAPGSVGGTIACDMAASCLLNLPAMAANSTIPITEIAPTAANRANRFLPSRGVPATTLRTSFLHSTSARMPARRATR